ncbi:hypothetical protein BBO_07721 [Beauveria brongniartii RCEF 3172]|uniref:Uncharacterized protein n=1 Tax=Beauveria brongniartii RCEF 3172 TaxID=1081107 RepID=A0A166YX74_9HYPO|nr:hypothetical protein BBO_07721 [Beauveria brongniartii RCEF 3172]
MPLQQPPVSGYLLRRALARVFKFLRLLEFLFARLHRYTRARLNNDHSCMVFLAATLLSITPIFFYRIHADAARMAHHAYGVGRDLGEVVRKNMLANRFLTVSLAIRALGVIRTGSVGNGVHRALLDTDMFQYSLLNQRERFAATYETFFLPGAMCLAFLYADGNGRLRRLIPRAYELLTRFYLRLLREPETLFRNPIPPRVRPIVWIARRRH